MLIWICNLTNNAGLDKYKCTGYGIGFYTRSEFLFTDESFGKNFIIFGVDMSSSVHVNSKGKDILILCEGRTQELDDAILKVEAKYPVKVIQPEKKSELNLYYIGSNSFLFVNATKVYLFKAKSSEIKDYALSLSNILKYFLIDDMKKK